MRLICYHGADLDGICAAAVAYWHLRDRLQVGADEIRLFPVNYGEPVPKEVLAAGQADEVWILDFSFPPEIMKYLFVQTAESVIWCDHHKTAIEAGHAGGYGDMDGRRDPLLAGCELTAEFVGSKSVPHGVHLLGRYDVWDHKDSAVLEFQFGCRADAPRDPANFWWRQVVQDKLTVRDVIEICDHGRAVQRYLDGADVLSTRSMFRGLLAWGPVAPRGASYQGAVGATAGTELRCLFLNRLGGSAALVKGAPGIAPDAELLVSFGWDGTQWRCELRNGPAAPELDLSAVAKAFGGGGHPHAAGFVCKTLPFQLEG